MKNLFRESETIIRIETGIHGVISRSICRALHALTFFDPLSDSLYEHFRGQEFVTSSIRNAPALLGAGIPRIAWPILQSLRGGLGVYFPVPVLSDSRTSEGTTLR